MTNGLVEIEGYRLTRLDRPRSRRGGGVVMYIRDDLDWDHIPDQYSVSTLDIEVLTIKISHPFQPNLFISTVYLPPKCNLSKAIEVLDILANHISINSST